MLKKESKIRVLENFYAIDYVFFGKPVTEVKSCCPLVREEYLTVKGALMSVFIEMLKMVDHQPKPLKEYVDSTSLEKLAKGTARIAREASRKIIALPQSRKNIKESVSQFLAENKKANVSQVIEQKITEKAFSVAVDALLIGRTLKESKEYSKLNEWEGRILEDSYKILRDSLVETAYQILDGKTELSEGPGAAAAAVGAGALIAVGAGIYITHKQKKECKEKYPNDPQKQWACYRMKAHA